MNLYPQQIDTKTFKQTIVFLKQVNEVNEIFMTVTPAEYKPELQIAKDILVQQNNLISRVIEQYNSESRQVPQIYRELFRENLSLIRLILMVPIPKVSAEIVKARLMR